MILKEQKRKCKFCLKTEKRIVNQEESAFVDDIKYFLNWNSNCTNCKKSDWESISESYLTENAEEMKLKDSLIELWRKDDKKSFNPQDDSYELSNIEIKKILNWIDKTDTTSFKREVLIECLCNRLDDLISEDPFNDERKLIVIELKKRKKLIEDNLGLLDSETKKVILKQLKEN